MKIIVNKTTEIALKNDEAGKSVMATYGDLLLITINQAPQSGFSISDIRSRLVIAAALDAGKEGEIKFEDADFVIVKKAFDDFKWSAIHKDLVDLSDTLNSL